MSKEAMKLALDALVAAFQGKDKTGQVTDAITAIREALAEQPAQHRAWFTVDELNAWADKKLKENPQWAEQPAQVDPCIDGSCSCCWAHFDEQPAQQEPVAWLKVIETPGGWGKFVEAKPHEKGAKPVYTSPPAQQEPVNKYCCHLCFNNSGQVFLDRMILCPECGNKRCPKATHHGLPCTKSNDLGQKGSIYDQPAQRTWVGMTDDEIDGIDESTWDEDHQSWGIHKFARAIEAKLREKNT